MATNSCTAHDPSATHSVLPKYLLISTLVQASARFVQSTPLGHRANGVRSVSCVVLVAALASHTIGPTPATNNSTKARVWAPCIDHRRRGRPQS